MYLAGYTNKEIAEIIKLSEDTIENEIKTIRISTGPEKIGKLLANFQDSEFEVISVMFQKYPCAICFNT